MKMDFRIKKFCPHCEHESLQNYVTHHAYDEKQGGLWDRDPDTAKEPAAYFVFACETCDEVLIYHLQAIDEFEFETLFPHTRNGIECMTWNENEIERRLRLMWPQLWEDIHQYIPKTVRRVYLKALKQMKSPEGFAREIGKALEAICEERRVTGPNLKMKIDRLCDEALIPEMKGIAHRIRETRNDAVHENENKVTLKDVTLVQNFFRVLINHIYVLPMQVEEWNVRHPGTTL